MSHPTFGEWGWDRGANTRWRSIEVLLLLGELLLVLNHILRVGLLLLLLLLLVLLLLLLL